MTSKAPPTVRPRRTERNVRIGARLRAERKARIGAVRAMAEALRDSAPERERRYLPTMESLCRMIRGWEAGDHALYERSRLMYCRAFALTEEALFGPDHGARLPAAPAESETPPAPLAGHGGANVDLSDFDDFDDMKRRELLRLLSVAGVLVATPDFDGSVAIHGDAIEAIGQYEHLNSHLWQVFALSRSKLPVYPVVREQLDTLTGNLRRAHNEPEHKRLCALAGDLFQLAGEIMFDGDRYTYAAHCYTLAADASKQAGAFDLWACALTRHAFIGMYERRFGETAAMLEAAAQVARKGDSQLSTRYWVAAVQAEACAGLGDLDACNRALDSAEQVRALTGSVMPGGWLRFDGSRLAEQRGACYRQLGKANLAETALTDALNQAVSLRRRGSVLTDLAMLGLQRHDLDQMLGYATQAVELAEQTSSAGYVGRKLHTLRDQLGPVMNDYRVTQLSDRIAHL